MKIVTELFFSRARRCAGVASLFGASWSMALPVSLVLATVAFLTSATVAAPLARPSSPQDQPKVRAWLSAGVVKLGGQVVLNVEVEGTERGRLLSVPEVPGLAMGRPQGPHVQRSFQLLGGRSRNSIPLSWSLAMRPSRAGEFTIPPLKVEVDGREVTTEALLLKAVEDLKGAELGVFEVRGLPEQVYEGQPFELELRFGWDRSLGIDRANLILPWWGSIPGLLEVEGQPASLAARYVEIRLNTRQNIRVEELPPEEVRGRPYRMFRLRRRYMATRTGELAWPGSTFEFGRVTERGGIGFFDARPDKVENFYVPLPERTSAVRPIPKEGRPFDYSGAVGTFQAAVSTDRRDVDEGESIKVTVTWSGDGNCEFFTVPDPSRLASFSDFRLYGTSERRRWDSTRVVFDLAPISSGVTEIPSIPLEIFDTTRERFTSVLTEAVPIRVRALAGAGGLEAAPGTSSHGLDIRDIQTTPVTVLERHALPAFWTPASFGFLLVCWFGGRTLVRRRGDPAAPAARRRRRARRVLARELRRSTDPAQRTRQLYAFLAARSGEAPGAWLGRAVDEWAEDNCAGQELVEAIGEFLLLVTNLEAGVWSARQLGSEVDKRDLLRAADRVLGAGL